MLNAEQNQYIESIDKTLRDWEKKQMLPEDAPNWRAQFDQISRQARALRGWRRLFAGAAALQRFKDRYSELDATKALIREGRRLVDATRQRLPTQPVDSGELAEPVWPAIREQQDEVRAALGKIRLDLEVAGPRAPIDRGPLRQSRDTLDRLARRALCLQSLANLLDQAKARRGQLLEMGRQELDDLLDSLLSAQIPSDPDGCSQRLAEVRNRLSPYLTPVNSAAPEADNASAEATPSPSGFREPIQGAGGNGQLDTSPLNLLFDWVNEVKLSAVRNDQDQTTYAKINKRFRTATDPADKAAALTDAKALLQTIQQRACSFQQQGIEDLRRVLGEVQRFVEGGERIDEQVTGLGASVTTEAYQFNDWRLAHQQVVTRLGNNLESSQPFQDWWHDLRRDLRTRLSQWHQDRAPFLNGHWPPTWLPDDCPRLDDAGQRLDDADSCNAAQSIIERLPAVLDLRDSMDRCQKWLENVRLRCDALARLPVVAGPDPEAPAGCQDLNPDARGAEAPTGLPGTPAEQSLACGEERWRKVLVELAARLEACTKAHTKLRNQPTRASPLRDDANKAPDLLTFAEHARQSARVLFQEAETLARECAEQLRERLKAAGPGLTPATTPNDLLVRLERPQSMPPGNDASLRDLLGAVEDLHEAIKEANELSGELMTPEEECERLIQAARSRVDQLQHRYARPPIEGGLEGMHQHVLPKRLLALLDGAALPVADAGVRQAQLKRVKRMIDRAEGHVKRMELAQLDDRLVQLRDKASQTADPAARTRIEQVLQEIEKRIPTAVAPAELLDRADQCLKRC